MKQFSLYILFISTISIGCSAIKETSKHQMETGIYKIRNWQNKHYCAVIEDESVALHPVSKTKRDG
jgi:hypothetical protein